MLDSVPNISTSVLDFIKFIALLGKIAGFRFRHAKDWVSCTERLPKASPLVYFRLCRPRLKAKAAVPFSLRVKHVSVCRKILKRHKPVSLVKYMYFSRPKMCMSILLFSVGKNKLEADRKLARL